MHKAALSCPYCGDEIVVEDDTVICFECDLRWNERGWPM